MMRRLAPIFAGAAASAFYLLLIDTADLPELLVIPVVALLCGGCWALVEREHVSDAEVSLRWLGSAWRAVIRVPPDVLLLLGQLIRQLRSPSVRRGRLRAITFNGGSGGPELGRQALAESLGSFAPNTIVVGVDPERQVMLVHQLQPHGGRDELDVLRLG